MVAGSRAGTVDAIALADGFRNRVGRSADGVASLAVAPDGRHVAIVHGGLGSASSRFTVFGVWGSRTTDLDRQLATTPGGPSRTVELPGPVTEITALTTA